MITNNFLALVGKNKTTSSDISKKTGIAGSTLSKFASEKSDIKLSTLIKICDYFGCELSDLIEYDPQIIN
ncbi:helix-turn-helix domain-containing protein [Lactococcus lactis]|uniref:helix-turn-helix domain-containing protein n=1 Tax=Lactococcus lactis TaxID=1358 RepID=UPI00071DB983|nr:helix-turn-helix domain-containing protein [Lactococcus lactis]ARE10261.1 helix-turn-helix domain-containing protein [Lactococcus lactis subsp. lactis]MCT0080273.1 helix-turn-helix domain-containing protein [Lactococcus lactis subsp. lactis]NRD17131.1 helix-turn-helix domain-containing protein [Lactococcus lactis subsp. lactis]URL09292.1 helix-turn-helix domain-containing protein [Lactococcus lactis subsp. lactis]